MTEFDPMQAVMIVRFVGAKSAVDLCRTRPPL